MIDRRIAALCAGNFVVACSYHTVVGLLGDIARSFDVTVSQAGFVVAVFAITSFVAAPMLATVASRLDRRLLLVGVMVMGALANGLAVVSDRFDGLLLTRVFAAIASATFTPQAAATVSVLVPENRRGPAIALVMAGWGLASVIGVPLGIMVGQQYGWRLTMAGVGLCGLIVAAFLWVSLPAGLSTPALSLRSWGRVLSNRALLLVLGSSLLLGAGNSVAFVYLAPLVERAHPGGGIVPVLFAIHGAASLSSAMLSAALIPRIGPRVVARLMETGVLVCLVLLPFCVPYIPLLLVLQGIWSLSYAGYPGIQQTRLVLLNPGLSSATVALNSSLNYLSAAVGTMIGGLLFEMSWADALPWGGAPFVILAGVATTVSASLDIKSRKTGA